MTDWPPFYENSQQSQNDEIWVASGDSVSDLSDRIVETLLRGERPLLAAMGAAVNQAMKATARARQKMYEENGRDIAVVPYFSSVVGEPERYTRLMFYIYSVEHAEGINHAGGINHVGVE